MRKLSEILPSYIDNTNFKYIEIDGKYIVGLKAVDYPKKSSFLEIINGIPKDIVYDMSIYLQKQDSANVLKELTYYISSSGTEIKTAKENQIDIDVLSKTKEDAKNLRKDIQINNEEVYHINIYFTFYSNNKKQLLSNLKTFQSRLFSKQIASSITNFRHLDSYLLSIPTNDLIQSNSNSNYRNITTSALGNIFPFVTKTVFDPHGVIFGYTLSENRLCNIDIFEEKYLNANMCFFGSSGSGKSYFAKLMILREFFIGKKQFVFDPEGEYSNIVKNLNGVIIKFDSKDTKISLNILDINNTFVEVYKNNFLNEKINRLSNFLQKICDFTDKESVVLKDAIKKSYNNKAISSDIDSIYLSSNTENVYLNKKIKSFKDIPCIEDVLENIKGEKIRKKLKDGFLNKYKVFCGYTTYNTDCELISYDFTNLSFFDSNILIEYFLEHIQFELKNSKVSNNTIIYMDEIWKYISINTSSNLSENIFMLFKTIRKLGGSIVAITQDISDFFALDNGNYGKSILNNCGFKLFFKIDYADTEILQKLSVLTNEDVIKITTIDKGQAILGFKRQVAAINIKANDYEKELIGEELNENFSGIK
ncbi:MAG: DUF87 domain-containing protein [Clostridia bacterium]